MHFFPHLVTSEDFSSNFVNALHQILLLTRMVQATASASYFSKLFVIKRNLTNKSFYFLVHVQDIFAS